MSSLQNNLLRCYKLETQETELVAYNLIQVRIYSNNECLLGQRLKIKENIDGLVR